MADLVLGPFTVGIDQVSPDTKLPEGAVRDAVNGTFNRAGEFESRAGFELSYSAADIHSLWTDRAGNAFCGHGSQICSVRLGANGDPIVTPIYDTGSASPISFDDLLDSVVFANLGAVGSIRAGAFQPLAPSTPAHPRNRPSPLHPARSSGRRSPDGAVQREGRESDSRISRWYPAERCPPALPV